MQKRMIAALSIAILLFILGYGLYWLLFERSDTRVKKGEVAEKLSPPSPKALEPAQQVDTNRITVLSVNGKVKRRKRDSPWVPVRSGDALLADEAIRSEEDGSAVLEFGQTAKVEIAPQSEFTVNEISRTVSRVRLEVGRISAVVSGKGESRLKVEAKGSDAVAETKKGEFSMLADGEGQVAVATQKGRVRLSAKKKTVELEAGMQSVVQAKKAPAAPEPIPQSLFLKVAKPRALVLRERETVIEGDATPGAVISINRVRVAVDDTGQFRHTVTLSEGKNPITVVLEDVTGRRKEAELPEITVDTRPPRVQSEVRWGNLPQKEVRSQ